MNAKEMRKLTEESKVKDQKSILKEDRKLLAEKEFPIIYNKLINDIKQAAIKGKTEFTIYTYYEELQSLLFNKLIENGYEVTFDKYKSLGIDDYPSADIIIIKW